MDGRWFSGAKPLVAVLRMDSILGMDAFRSSVLGAWSSWAPLVRDWNGLEFLRPLSHCLSGSARSIDDYCRHGSALFVSRSCPASFSDLFIPAGDGPGEGFLSDSGGFGGDLRGDMLRGSAVADVRRLNHPGVVGAPGDDGGVCVYSWPIRSKPRPVLFDLRIVGRRHFYSPGQATPGMVDHGACVV